LKPTSALDESPVHVDPYCVRIYSLDLPWGTYVRTFALSGGVWMETLLEPAYVLPRLCSR